MVASRCDIDCLMQIRQFNKHETLLKRNIGQCWAISGINV